MKTIIRLISGRIAYERRIAEVATQLATKRGYFDSDEALRIYNFMSKIA